MSKSDPIQNVIPEGFYERLFAQLPERKIVVTAKPPYVFVEANDSHLAMTGKKRDEVIGKGLFEVFPDTSDEYKTTGISPLARTFEQVVRTRRNTADTIRYDITNAEGILVEKYWRIAHYPILGSTGSVDYILQVSSDVTEEIISQRGFKETKEQLEGALSVGKVGSWVLDVDANIIVLDANLSKMSGISAVKGRRGLPADSFTDLISAEDHERTAAAMRHAIGTKAIFEEEFRIESGKNRKHWVLARGRAEQRNGHTIFRGVIVDITERRNLQAEVALARQQDKLNRQAAGILQERNNELEALSRTKDEFVALASHQLRTPATAVKQYIGMVLQGYVGTVSEVQTEMLEKAFESNERQIQIINQILNAARVDTGRLVMSTAPVDIRAMVEGVSGDMKATLEAHNQTLSKHLISRPVTVMADHGYLRMAIENIVHNASNYTTDGGTITIKLTQSTKHCTLSISDTGVGIKKADIGRLFTKFTRIHNPLSVQAGGSGIGLYLAAEVVRLHKGTITVKSQIRKGTEFTITLPVIQSVKHEP